MKRALAALLAAVMALGLGACTAQPKAGASQPSAVPPASTASSRPAATVKLRLTVDPEVEPALLAGIYMAKAQGYFAREGLSLTVTIAADGAAALQDASQGALLVTGQAAGLAQALSQGQALTAVAALQQHSDAGVMALQTKNLDRPAALADRSCVVADRPLDRALLNWVLQADGADPKRVRLQTLARTTPANSALQSPGVDALAGSYCRDALACREAKMEARFLFYRDVDPALDFYPAVVAANQSLCQQKEALRACLRALRSGYAYAALHPDVAAKGLLQEQPDLSDSQALLQRRLTWLAGQYRDSAPLWGQIDGARWAAFYAWMNGQKLTAKPISTGAAWSNAYLPPAPAAVDSQAT